MSETPSAEKDAPIVVILTRERARQGLSLEAVARRVGTGKSSIHNWEHGDRSPNLDNLQAWARALGYQVRLTRVAPRIEDRA